MEECIELTIGHDGVIGIVVEVSESASSLATLRFIRHLLSKPSPLERLEGLRLKGEAWSCLVAIDNEFIAVVFRCRLVDGGMEGLYARAPACTGAALRIGIFLTLLPRDSKRTVVGLVPILKSSVSARTGVTLDFSALGEEDRFVVVKIVVPANGALHFV